MTLFSGYLSHFASIFIFFAFLHTLSARQLTQEEIEGLVNVHNEFRLANNVPEKLIWSPSLALKASEYAETLSLSTNCTELEHSDSEQRIGCGENLAMTQNLNLHLPVHERLTLGWRKESAVDDGATYNHATQMLWSKSVFLGCGYYNKNGCEKLVCRYYPSGNLYGTSYSQPTTTCTAKSNIPLVDIGDSCVNLDAHMTCGSSSSFESNTFTTVPVNPSGSLTDEVPNVPMTPVQGFPEQPYQHPTLTETVTPYHINNGVPTGSKRGQCKKRVTG